MALTWFVGAVGDAPAFARHDGGTNGQVARLMLVPEAGFALAILTNHSPAGNDVLRAVTRAALSLYLGVDERDSDPIELGAEQLAEYAGLYSNPWADADVRLENGRLVFEYATYKAGFPDEGHAAPTSYSSGHVLVLRHRPRVRHRRPRLSGMRADFVRDGAGQIVLVPLRGPPARRTNLTWLSRTAPHLRIAANGCRGTLYAWKNQSSIAAKSLPTIQRERHRDDPYANRQTLRRRR